MRTSSFSFGRPQKQYLQGWDNRGEEGIIFKNYSPFKTTELKQFSQEKNASWNNDVIQVDYSTKLLVRMASHPKTKPGRHFMPSEFVETTRTNGSLRERCHDFRNLTPQEQSAQVQYLWVHWEKRDLLDDLLSENGRVTSHPAYARVRQKYEDEMKEAQGLWEQMFGMSICEKVTATGKRMLAGLSPTNHSKRRRV